MSDERVAEIRRRVHRADRAVSFLGAAGILRADIEWLLAKVEALEEQFAQAMVWRDNAITAMTSRPDVQRLTGEHEGGTHGGVVFGCRFCHSALVEARLSAYRTGGAL